MARRSDEFGPGDRLGKYEIICDLAAGGIATIYLARVSGTAGFEKLVVLKCMSPSLALHDAYIAMFLDEARLAASLRHSNIADVLDLGVEDGTYFLAMEYIHGQNARRVRIEAARQHRRMPLDVALAIVTGLASALAYVHSRTGTDGPLGLVHRNVSPSNVQVGYEGAVKLLDFGAARANRSASYSMRTDSRAGKASYMSPEQCRGESIDKRSDLFSLGIILYELTTWRRPFAGHSDFEVMESIVAGAFAAPSEILRDYPPELEAMVLRLLAVPPPARYPDASVLLDDIEAFTGKHGLLATSSSVAKFMRLVFVETAIPTLGQFGDDKTPTSERARGQEVRFRMPRRARTKPGLGHHSSAAAFAALALDPIDALREELVRHLDAGVRAGETLETRACRRIETLLQYALGYVALGEAEKAVTAVELALDEQPRTSVVHALLQSRVDRILTVYEALLDDPYQVPMLVRPIHQLNDVEIDSSAHALVSLIDGTATIRDLLARSGMQRLELYHHLCQLLLRGIVFYAGKEAPGTAGDLEC